MDAFGSKTMIMPLDEDHFTANVYVEVSPTFFAWLTNFGNQIEIANPPQVREQFKNHLAKITDLYK